MNLFYEEKKICICCNERVQKNEMEFVNKDIGICRVCHRRLEPVTKDSPFEGTPEVDYVFSAYYYNDTLKGLIGRYKFRRERAIGLLFADMMYDRVRDIPIFDSLDFIAPMPLSLRRIKERSFNQAEVMAKYFSEVAGIPYSTCVCRSKNTVPQSTLKARDRVKNITDSFVADKSKVAGKHILLFDDIFTTGSTMNDCAKELKSKGASKVVGMTFAKAYRKYLHN